MSKAPNIVFITVGRDKERYQRNFTENAALAAHKRVYFDNSQENLPIPVRYNAFLDSWDYAQEAWFVFAHDDFRILANPVAEFENLPKDALYGPIGCARRQFLCFYTQKFCGTIEECKRGEEEKGNWRVGEKCAKFTPVETFDCCCVIVHSSLVAAKKLRFDENLPFDMYVEDFCAAAYCKGVNAYILPILGRHESGSVPTERLWKLLPYLEQKYPQREFVGTCTYFGTPSLAGRLQRWLKKLVKVW